MLSHEESSKAVASAPVTSARLNFQDWLKFWITRGPLGCPPSLADPPEPVWPPLADAPPDHPPAAPPPPALPPAAAPPVPLPPEPPFALPPEAEMPPPPCVPPADCVRPPAPPAAETVEPPAPALPPRPVVPPFCGVVVLDCPQLVASVAARVMPRIQSVNLPILNLIAHLGCASVAFRMLA